MEEAKDSSEEENSEKVGARNEWVARWMNVMNDTVTELEIKLENATNRNKRLAREIEKVREKNKESEKERIEMMNRLAKLEKQMEIERQERINAEENIETARKCERNRKDRMKCAVEQYVERDERGGMCMNELARPEDREGETGSDRQGQERAEADSASVGRERNDKGRRVRVGSRGVVRSEGEGMGGRGKDI